MSAIIVTATADTTTTTTTDATTDTTGASVVRSNQWIQRMVGANVLRRGRKKSARVSRVEETQQNQQLEHAIDRSSTREREGRIEQVPDTC